MIKLIKLEYRKNNIKKYIRISVISTLLLSLFIFAMTYLGIARDSDSGMVEASIDGITSVTNVEFLTMVVFLVLAAVMQSAFIVDAYRNKTMDLMFQYPIQRKKIILSKILAVLIFCFAALIVCKYFIYIILYLGSFRFTPDFSIDTISFLSPTFHASVILQALSTVCLSILTLYIGLLLKSTKAPIITAFILFAVTQGGFGNFSLANNKIFYFIIIGISILCLFPCIDRVEAKDVDGGKVS